MKIGQTPDNSIQIQVGNAAAAQKAGQNASSTASKNAAQSTRSAGVAVTVSTLARGLEKTGKGEAAEIDVQKVASVRAAIEGGTYVVNPEAIADKLLSNAQEMLNHTTR
nr:flagellar biosynthesis anti-sigma factor FlgM [Rhodoferax sp.]